MLAYPPIQLRDEIDPATWNSVVSSWVKLVNAKAAGSEDFVLSYLNNATAEDNTPLRPVVFKLITDGHILTQPSAETVWAVLELYGGVNVTKVNKFINGQSSTMVGRLRRLALHYLHEDHLNVLEPLAVLLSDSNIAKELVTDDFVRELHRIGGETAHKVLVMSEQALQVDPSKVATIQDLFPQLGDKVARRLLKQHQGDVESVTAYLLENPDFGDETTNNDAPVVASTSNQQPSMPSTTRHQTAEATDIPKNFRFGKKQSKPLDRAGKNHLETTLRLLYEADEDEYDDTYDDAEAQEEEVKTSAAVDKIEQYLWYCYKQNSGLFKKEMRKTKDRADMKGRTDWSDEQIEGWGLMLDRHPKRKAMVEDKYFGMRDNEVELLNVKPKNDSKPKGSDKHNDKSKDNVSNSNKGKEKAPQQGKNTSTNNSNNNNSDNANPADGAEISARDAKRKERNKAKHANHNRKAGHAKKMNNA